MVRPPGTLVPRPLTGPRLARPVKCATTTRASRPLRFSHSRCPIDRPHRRKATDAARHVQRPSVNVHASHIYPCIIRVALFALGPLSRACARVTRTWGAAQKKSKFYPMRRPPLFMAGIDSAMISKVARNTSAPESNVHHMHHACNYVIFSIPSVSRWRDRPG